MKNLVIVESPAKAKTIKKYLGKGYDVVASMGHVRDLPEKRLGVDIKKNFSPKYEIIKGKNSLKNLKRKLKNLTIFFWRRTLIVKEKPFHGIWLIFWDLIWIIKTELLSMK